MTKIGPLISIIIPTYNGHKTISHCLDAIKNQNYQNFEIIVVDDASTDETLASVQKYNVHLIKNNIRQGAGTARWQGTKEAKGEIIVFLDTDCVPGVNLLKEISKNLTNDVGGIGGEYIAGNQGIVPTFFSDLVEYYFFSTMRKHTNFLVGGISAFWKYVLMEIYPQLSLKPFSKIAAGEDTLLTYNISKKYKLKHIQNIKVKHLGPNFIKFIFQQINWGYSRTILAISYPSDKLFNSKEIHLFEQFFQCLTLSLTILLFLIGLLINNLAIYSVGSFLIYYILTISFNNFIYKKNRNFIYLFIANILLIIRNICLFIGIIKGIRYLLSTFKYKISKISLN